MALCVLAEAALHHVAGGQLVQVVGVPLHHGRALLQVGGFVVDAGYSVFSVGKLRLNMLFGKTVFSQGGGCDMTKAMACLPSAISQPTKRHVERHVAQWFGAVVATGE